MHSSLSKLEHTTQQYYTLLRKLTYQRSRNTILSSTYQDLCLHHNQSLRKYQSLTSTSNLLRSHLNPLSQQPPSTIAEDDLQDPTNQSQSNREQLIETIPITKISFDKDVAQEKIMGTRLNLERCHFSISQLNYMLMKSRLEEEKRLLAQQLEAQAVLKKMRHKLGLALKPVVQRYSQEKDKEKREELFLFLIKAFKVFGEITRRIHSM